MIKISELKKEFDEIFAKRADGELVDLLNAPINKKDRMDLENAMYLLQALTGDTSKRYILGNLEIKAFHG